MSDARPAASQKWRVNAPTKGVVGRPLLREMIEHREIAWLLAVRDIQLRYKQTLLGVGWSVLSPLLGVLLFTVVFGKLVGVPSDGVPYAVFVFAGLMGWSYFAGGLTSAAMSLVWNESLVTKIYFPRLLAPLSGFIPQFLDFLVAVPIFVIMCIATDTAPGPSVLTLPLWIVLLTVIAFGIGCLFSGIIATYRDAEHGVGYLLSLGLFASPVVYPSTLADGKLSWLYHLNPAVGPIDGLRWALIGRNPPNLEDLLSASIGIAIAAFGVLYFSRIESRIADVI